MNWTGILLALVGSLVGWHVKAYIIIKLVQIPITADASVTGWSRASIDGLRGGRALVGGVAATPAGSWQPAPPVIPHGGRSLHRCRIPPWFRFVTLAAYQGSDKQQLHLEVQWAPILTLAGCKKLTLHRLVNAHFRRL